MSQDASLYNLFPNTKPAKGKYLEVISGLLRNKPPAAVLKGAATTNKPADPESPIAEFGILLDLCQDAAEQLGNEDVVLEFETEPEDTLVLVGDVHGQFRDLQQHIFALQHQVAAATQDGKQDSLKETAKTTPGRDVNFLFLGDFVDRGPMGIEVITLLLALKVEYPEKIRMIRGNHEEGQVCRIYGFLAECRTKLTVECWNEYNKVFTTLPLGAIVTINGVVDNKREKVGCFFCCHGGLTPNGVNIGELRFLQRQEYGQGMMGEDDTDRVDGLLWSDPAEHGGFRHNMRGCGYTFGSDTTAEFCKANEVDFVCRAHQMVMKGYQWDHESKLLTLFSAPNYCGINNNDGALGIIRGLKQNGVKPLPETQEPVEKTSGPPELNKDPCLNSFAMPCYNESNINIDFEVYTSHKDVCTMFMADPKAPVEVAPPPRGGEAEFFDA